MDSLLRLKPYFRRYRRLLIFGFIAILLSTLFEVYIPLIIRDAIDGLQEEVSSGGLLRYAGLIIGVTLMSGIFSFLTRQTIIVASRKIEYDLRNDFFRHLQTLSLSYYINTPTGELMAHATNDINQVRNFLGPGIMYSTNTIVGFIVIIAIMFSIHPVLTLLTLLPLPLVSVTVFYIGRVVYRRTEKIQEQYATITTRAQENLSGIRVVKAFTREQNEINEFRKECGEYFERNMKLVGVQSVTRPLLYLLIGLSLVIVVWYGGGQVIEGNMTIGEITAILIYLGMLIWPMIAFGWMINIIQRAAASMNRLNRIFDTKSDITNSESTDFSLNRIEGNIEFRNVSFQYPGTSEPVLKNISLKIEAGKSLAIIGYTGSGKTTLVNLIPRLFDAKEGEIMIDGHPIRNIPLDVIRSNIGFVPQESFLFSETLKENIIFGADDGAISNLDDLAGIAQLKDDVYGFPHKYDTLIGERGITLSGGQKQRTSLARALAGRPSILILDDAFSAVDTYTEEEILKKLKEVMKSTTSIIIGHRISTVKDADEIIVLDDGEIKERGRHDTLVQQGGIYANLYRKQLLEKELDEL